MNRRDLLAGVAAVAVAPALPALSAAAPVPMLMHTVMREHDPTACMWFGRDGSVYLLLGGHSDPVSLCDDCEEAA